MVIQRFGNYVLTGRKEAAMMALIWTIVPFMGWVGAVIMVLVTLRKGPFEGFLILLWITLPSIVFALLGYKLQFVYGVLGGSLVSWLLAVVLCQTRSWVSLLQAAALLGMIVVVAIHGVMPDINGYWYNLLTKYYTDAKTEFTLQLTSADLKSLIMILAKLATGIQAVILLFLATFNIIIARWWQATLFNPGGLSKELYNVRLGISADLILVAIVVSVFMGFALAWDLLPLILTLFLVAGLSLFHSLAQRTKAAWAVLLGLYGLLILFFPYIGILTVALAVADTFMNFRGRIGSVNE